LYLKTHYNDVTIRNKWEKYLLLCNSPFYHDIILGNDACYYTTVVLFLIFYRVYYYYYYYYYLTACTNGRQKWEGVFPENCL
jgi:hypothetical protein